MALLLNEIENASLFTDLSKRIPQGRSGPPIHSENFHPVPCCSVFNELQRDLSRLATTHCREKARLMLAAPFLQISPEKLASNSGVAWTEPAEFPSKAAQGESPVNSWQPGNETVVRADGCLSCSFTGLI